MPGSFLSLNGQTMFMDGSAIYNYKPVFWVISDNENVKVTGTVYAWGGEPLTSLTAQGGSASAEFPARATWTRLTASAAPYYATYISSDGITDFNVYWSTAHKYGSGSGHVVPGQDIVIGSYSGQLNTFTARGNFASGSSTGSKGWEVPAKITALDMSLPTLEGEASHHRSVSAYTNYMIKEIPWNQSTLQSSTIAQIGLSGTFSSVSGLISQEGITKRTGSYVGKITYPMIQAGPAFLLDCICGSGGTRSGTSLIRTLETSRFTAAQWTVGSSLSAGNSSTLWIGAYYTGGYINPYTTGTWMMTGIAL